jgi:probable rRNA maturation factor
MSVAGDSSIHFASPDEAPDGGEPPERLVATVVEEEGDWSRFGTVEEAVHQAAAALARHRQLQRARGQEASVVLGSDALVRRLNKAYRGKDAPTNVLSFPYQSPPGAGACVGSAYLGDVVLAAETIRKEAASRGIQPKHHLQHLVVHGLLHLLGHDHDSDAAAEAMERLEAEVLASIGVADPYADRPGSES